MSNADWYARKLGQPRPAPPQHPAQESVRQRPAVSPSLPYVPEPEEYAPRQATLQKKASACPDCGGGNFLTSSNSLTRCFDCGYNARFNHDDGGPGGDGKGIVGIPTVATHQISKSNNYNPTTIIGRVE